jgi:signal transduction histidine kinase
MFKKLHLKLTVMSSIITAIIVLIIILICLSVSETRLREQEEYTFLLQTNTISADLLTSQPIQLEWYLRNTNNGYNTLYIEADAKPIVLNSLNFGQTTKALINDIKAYIKKNYKPLENDYYSNNISKQYFTYRNKRINYLVMNASIRVNNGIITYIYLYRMDSLEHNILMQRLSFFGIFLFSIIALFLFSYFFTSHVLKPVLLNQQKQKVFVASASHELRSPLAVFKMGLSILKTGPTPDKQERFIQLMTSEVIRMELLVSDLLFLSKSAQDHLSYKFRLVKISNILREVHEKYLPIAENKKITLLLDLQNLDEHLVNCDSLRMEQVIIILLDNAINYTPQGKSITIRGEMSQHHFHIKVIDTGTGIDDIEKEKIFDTFYQVSSSRTDKTHVGLGLSIAKEICTAHGGKISVYDTPEGGSTFHVTISNKKDR